MLTTYEWSSRGKKLKEEDEYLEKGNERLRMMVVSEGREHLKQNMQYSHSRDPMFNGQDKTAGEEHAMDLPEVPAPATNICQYDAWITDFFRGISCTILQAPPAVGNYL
jgi:hypothetical protein